MNQLIGSLTLVEETCCRCYTHFAMDSVLNNNLRTNGGSFYCPNGHSQYYTDTEVKRLKKQLEDANKKRAWAEDEEARVRSEFELVKKEKAAIKGQLTKTRNRIANGLCPCCNRTFKQLSAHMANKHPEFKAVVT